MLLLLLLSLSSGSAAAAAEADAAGAEAGDDDDDDGCCMILYTAPRLPPTEYRSTSLETLPFSLKVVKIMIREGL